MKIEIPHRFRLAMTIANALHYDWAWNNFIETRKLIRAFGSEFFSMNESKDDSGMTKFTIRFVMHGAEVEVWMKDHKNSGTYSDGRKMEDWRVHRAEVHYDNTSPQRTFNPSLPATLVKRYNKEALLKVKRSPHGWYHCEVLGELKHIGE